MEAEPEGSSLEFQGVGGIIGMPIGGSCGVKHIEPGVTNPLFALVLAVAAGLFGFTLSFIAWARIIPMFISGLNGVAIAVWCGVPLGLAFAVLSFTFVWKTLNA